MLTLTGTGPLDVTLDDLIGMRVLTVKQPYAWAIIHGGKPVENRTRNLAGAWRGLVAIHAGLSDYQAAPVEVLDSWRSWWEHTGRPPWQRGHIIGVVNLTDVHHADDCYDGSEYLCSQWAADDQYHLVLENPRPLAVPIPYKGGLGLRTIRQAAT